MKQPLNTLQIKSLESFTARAPAHVIGAIQNASAKSGVDFSYLVQQAAAESSFNPTAKARTSSATGLYQFIDSTWLQMIERYGEEFGINTKDMSRRDILNLRNDPKTASFMAAAFASENEKTLKANWGGEIGATELYLAHFLGASGASSFLNARDANPLRPAADLFPAAARANRNVFYDSQSGRPRTMQEVYAFFDNKFQIKSTPENYAMASNNNPPTPPDMPRRKMPPNESNSLYAASNRNALSDSIVMQRAKAMRENQNNNGGVFRAYMPSAQNAAPLFSLNARPVDVMILTQVSTPSKVIRDDNV